MIVNHLEWQVRQRDARIAALEADVAALRAKCEAGERLIRRCEDVLKGLVRGACDHEVGMCDPANHALEDIAAYDAAREGAGNTTTNAAKPQE